MVTGQIMETHPVPIAKRIMTMVNYIDALLNEMDPEIFFTNLTKLNPAVSLNTMTINDKLAEKFNSLELNLQQFDAKKNYMNMKRNFVANVYCINLI